MQSVCKPLDLLSCREKAGLASGQCVNGSQNNFFILPFFDGNLSPDKAQGRQNPPSINGE